MRKKKYSVKKINDFLENEEASETWDSFIMMMYDKFGDEIVEMLDPVCKLVGYSYSSGNISKKIEEIKKIADSM